MVLGEEKTDFFQYVSITTICNLNWIYCITIKAECSPMVPGAFYVNYRFIA